MSHPSYIMVIDTETTGLFPRGKPDITDSDAWECCRLVQVAWELYDGEGKFIKSDCLIVKPDGYVIPPIPAGIHGITTEIATEKGQPVREVLDRLYVDLEQTDLIVAHNMSFDDMVIRSELYRHSVITALATWDMIEKRCTMRMAQVPGRKWLKLGELYTLLFNKPPEGKLHTADVDTRICAEIFFHLYFNPLAIPGSASASAPTPTLPPKLRAKVAAAAANV